MSVQFCAVTFAILFLNGCLFYQKGVTHKYIRYTVQEGDSVYSIAQHFSVTSKDIWRLNDLDPEKPLLRGAQLKIPYRGQDLGRARATIPRPKPDKTSVRQISLNEAKRYVGKLFWPVNGSQLNSYFGRRWGSFHEGIDLSGPIGIPIRAAHDGVVVYSDDQLRGYGNLVIVKGEGLLTVYGHNRSNVVDRGDRVRRGEVIAYLGNSGKSSGPHCHFETRIRDANGKFVAVDPLAFFPKGG